MPMQNTSSNFISVLIPFKLTPVGTNMKPHMDISLVY